MDQADEGEFYYDGEEHKKLQVRYKQLQRMYFDSEKGDVGPFWMTHAERKHKQFDRVTGSKTEVLLVSELREILASKNIKAKGNKKELQHIFTMNAMPFSRVVEKIEPGWDKKAKGMKQICYERGLLNIDRLKEYTMNGRKDENGNTIDAQFSLSHLLKNQKDFVEENTLLQENLKVMCEERGFIFGVDCSPKFHPEIAGEGVEYHNAHSKGYIRRIPWKERKQTHKFKQLVLDSMVSDRGSYLTVNRARKFARCQRDYMFCILYYTWIRT